MVTEESSPSTLQVTLRGVRFCITARLALCGRTRGSAPTKSIGWLPFNDRVLFYRGHRLDSLSLRLCSSAMSASMKSSMSPSHTRSRLWLVSEMRWSVTLFWGKL